MEPSLEVFQLLSVQMFINLIKACSAIVAGLMHLLFGLLLCITLIGIPWGKQHFKVAGLSLAPFGKDVKLGFYGKKNVSKKRPASSSYGIWFILRICRNPDFIIAFLGQVYLSTEQLPMKAKYQSVHILTFHHL